MPQDALDAMLLEKVDPATGMARFYVISVEPTLFPETALVRRWGRIGTAGRQRVELHPSPRSAGDAFRLWLRRKIHRGYIPRG